MKIRNKLLISYLVAFCIIFTLGSVVSYSIVRKNIESNIESELKNSTSALLNLVQTAVSVSIQNYLRAIAEKNLEIVQECYRLYTGGRLTEEEARKRAEAVLLSQKIGETGYIACVSSKGVMVIHPEPEWLNADINRYAFVQVMKKRKKGYIEYDWKNPGDREERPKAMFMAYFEPWDWIISVSSYRREFMSLVNIDDIRESVLSLRFGKTGYSFITDSKGNIIIHPVLKNINIFEEEGFPDYPLETMIQRKSGKIIYPWKNPGETRMREKLVMFTYLPEYEWIVASSSYLNEYYEPLNKINNIMVFTLLSSLFMLLFVTALISASITNPLGELANRLERGAQGDLSVRLAPGSGDEVGRISHYFNSFMDRLEASNENLKAEIRERKEAEAALRISEDRYRSVMEAVPDPIVVYDMQGRATYLNPAFTEVFGWTFEECRGKKLDHFVPDENWEETRKGLEVISSGRPLSTVQTRRYTKSGRIIDVSTRGSVYADRDGRPVGSVIIHRDVSDIKRLEKEVMDIGDRERQKIGQDLHDDLCPHLIGVEGLGKVLVRKLLMKAPLESQMAEKVTELIKDAISKTRSLARGLCPVYLVDHGFEFSLRELAANTESVFGISCRLNAASEVRIRDNLAATHLFYIVQEAVNNAIRHGDATEIVITIQGEGDRDRLILTVEDNGRGIPPDLEAKGMGLRIMGFRANMIRAGLEIRPGKERGTVIQIVLTGNADVHMEGHDG